MSHAYYAYWSARDGEWVGLCPSHHPLLSYLDPSPAAALTGIRELVEWLAEEDS